MVSRGGAWRTTRDIWGNISSTTAPEILLQLASALSSSHTLLRLYVASLTGKPYVACNCSVSSQPITPVSSPLRPTRASRVSQPSQGAQRGDQTPVALCTFDEHLMGLIPGYKPMGENELRQHMYAWGATEATYDQYAQCHNRLMEQKIQRGGVRVIGVRFPVVVFLLPSQHLKRGPGQASAR